jgi:hypothetical protein
VVQLPAPRLSASSKEPDPLRNGARTVCNRVARRYHRPGDFYRHGADGERTAANTLVPGVEWHTVTANQAAATSERFLKASFARPELVSSRHAGFRVGRFLRGRRSGRGPGRIGSSKTVIANDVDTMGLRLLRRFYEDAIWTLLLRFRRGRGTGSWLRLQLGRLRSEGCNTSGAMVSHSMLRRS